MIDSAALLNLVAVRDQESFALVRDLERIFLTQTPKLFQQMRKGIELEKTELISRAAHTLKTSCNYLGITEMSDICSLIETHAGNGELSFLDISALLQKLERAYCESTVELKKLISNLGNQTNGSPTMTMI